MTRMLGKRTKQCSPFSQCRECRRGLGCRTGSKARKSDRKNQRKIEKEQTRKEIANDR